MLIIVYSLLHVWLLAYLLAYLLACWFLCLPHWIFVCLFVRSIVYVQLIAFVSPRSFVFFYFHPACSIVLTPVHFFISTEDIKSPGLGCCGWILTVFSWVLVGLTFPVSMCVCLKVSAFKYWPCYNHPIYWIRFKISTSVSCSALVEFMTDTADYISP